jgi:Tetratricopeptide repeat
VNRIWQGSMIILFFLSSLALAFPQGSWGEVDAEQKRMEALRLYQEGLFQETGTGNLEVAYKTYQKLAAKYKELPDVAAVAFYHIGLVLEKLGQVHEAHKYFVLVLDNYPDQESVVERIEIKMKEYQSQQDVLWRLKKDQDEKKKEEKAAREADAEVENAFPPLALHLKKRKAKEYAFNQLGMGLHNLGFHVLYRYSDNKGLEGNFESETDGWSVGGRFYRFLEGTKVIQPYFGIQMSYLSKNNTDSGYMAGVFGGGAYQLMSWLHMNLDVTVEGGYFYRNQTSQPVEMSVSGRLALTYYFE